MTDGPTSRRIATRGLADIAEGMGLVDDLLDELMARRGKIPSAADRPGQGERRQSWPGQGMEGTECSDPTGTTVSGESSLLDQTGDELWKRFRTKARPNGPRVRRGEERRGS